VIDGAAAVSGQPKSPGNRLDRALEQRRPALIGYLPLGDPAMPRGLAELYVKGGIDVLEIGLPVPNPYLDGTTIRESMRRVSEANIGAHELSGLTARLRRRHPAQAIVWMTYGPAMRADELVRLAGRASIDGVLFVEPARYFGGLSSQLEALGVHLLHFLARELSEPDVAAARHSGGYVMLSATAGVTGAGHGRRKLPDSTPLIQRLRGAGVSTPVALGIGIHSPAQARDAVEMGADAVVIGSELVRQAAVGRSAVAEYLAALREAVS